MSTLLKIYRVSFAPVYCICNDVKFQVELEFFEKCTVFADIQIYSYNYRGCSLRRANEKCCLTQHCYKIDSLAPRLISLLMLYYMRNFIKVKHSCDCCKHVVLQCMNCNLQLDKHLAIYGSTAKILFAVVHNETAIVQQLIYSAFERCVSF